jgi:hypothetical protein
MGKSRPLMKLCTLLTEHRTQTNFSWNRSIQVGVVQSQILWNILWKTIFRVNICGYTGYDTSMWLSEEDLHRNVNCPILLGSLPCSDVELPRSIDKLVSSPILEGIVPTIDIYSTNSSFKLCEFA